VENTEKTKGTYLVQLVEHFNCARPIDAGVGDADAVFECGRASWGHVLAALVDVRLDHHAGDIPLSRCELLADVGNDEGLVAVVFGRIAIYVRLILGNDGK
jgi:hypothetical protein